MRLHWYILCAITFAQGVAAADSTIATIKLTDAGPDQSLPIDASFYLTGDPGKNPKSVQAVIVRKGSPFIVGSNGPSCSVLAKELNVDEAASPLLDAGRTVVSKQFPAATGDRDAEVLLSSSWSPPAAGASGDASTYKVLVTTDSEFFSTGYSFCVYVLARSTTVDSTSIAAAIGRQVAALDSCGNDLLPETHAAAVARININPALAARVPMPNCDAVRTQFEAEVRALLVKSLPASQQSHPPDCRIGANQASDYCKQEKAVDEAVTPALQAAINTFNARKKLLASLEALRPPLFAERKAGLVDLSDNFSRAVVTMLTRQTALFPALVKPPAKAASQASPTVDHVMASGSFVVGAVEVLDDDLHIRVAASTSPTAAQQQVVVGVTTKDLRVADGVTLYDVLRLRRRIVVLDQETSFTDLETLVRRVSLDTAWTDADSKPLTAFATKLDKVSAVFNFAPAVLPDAETQDGVTARVQLAMQPVDMANLTAVVDQLLVIAAQKPKWDAAKPKLTVALGENTTTIGPHALPMQIGFTQNTWVFSYLTPTIGYALVDSHDGWFSLPYAAVQLHLFPNPVDQPLYKNGFATDLKRAFAIEAGLSTTTANTFGPDSRYRGVFGLPTPFVAIALHVVPYTSLSLGYAFLERRETTLSVENPTSNTRFFVGLNVQVNIPDLIRKNSTTTTVQSPATH